jgi:hypothetical protein
VILEFEIAPQVQGSVRHRRDLETFRRYFGTGGRFILERSGRAHPDHFSDPFRGGSVRLDPRAVPRLKNGAEVTEAVAGVNAEPGFPKDRDAVGLVGLPGRLFVARFVGHAF